MGPAGGIKKAEVSSFYKSSSLSCCSHKEGREKIAQ